MAWKTEKLPTIWDKTTLIQLYKGKGSERILDNFRDIHIKEEIPKQFCHLVITAAKDNLIKNMTKFQIAKPGHRAQEHLYLLKSVMMLFEKMKKPMILSCMDL